MTTQINAQSAESLDSEINREQESYVELPSSWVIPGIASPDERMRIDPAGEFLLPHDRYDELDDLLDSDPELDSDEEDIDEVGDRTILEDLNESQRLFVRRYAETGSIDRAGEAIGMAPEERAKYLGQIALVMEQAVRLRRTRS